MCQGQNLPTKGQRPEKTS
uniref:Uncharacterized protein n=1 Tax=Anguilla anguilla TaxID=7936 RepID=A0A0E9S9R1_ANGAN